MKRPEGFDRPPAPDAPARAERGRPGTLAPDRKAERAAPKARDSAPERSSPAAPTAAAPARRTPAPSARPEPAPASPRASAAAELRAAARARKRAERAEVRRFTHRARRRRLGWVVTVSVVGSLALLIAVAVYSPLLALRHIDVEGTSRLSRAQVTGAIDGQLGTPLALFDQGELRDHLARFALIKSYSTEIVPPDTLIVRIVERTPVAAIADGSGFDLVDPAGVTVATSQSRPISLPLISLPAHRGVDGVAFKAMARVLVSLPADLLAKVDTVTATTSDDVAFTVIGTGEKVVWGSASDATAKAQTLVRIPGFAAGTAGDYDVSSPGIATYTPSS